jgi:hypothetical protein
VVLNRWCARLQLHIARAFRKAAAFLIRAKLLPVAFARFLLTETSARQWAPP